MSIHVDGPFGGCDEQKETDAFEELLGYRRAQVLDSLFVRLFTAGWRDERIAKEAKREGFTDEEVNAFLHLWNQ